MVAILAVLVGALAAGSGGFGSSTSAETNRINASTVIEQGSNFKAGFERLHGGALDLNELILSPSYSSGAATRALYSATGGGLTVQSPAAGTIATTGATSWRFVPQGNFPGLGGSGNDLAVVIGIKTAAVCKAINAIIFGKDNAAATTLPDASAATVTLNDTGSCTDVTVDTNTSGCNIAANQFDVSATAAVNGYSQVCVDAGSDTYYFYQVLLVQ